VREIGVKGNYTVWYPVAGGELKDGLRCIKTDGDVVRFLNEYKAEESVTFDLEHLNIKELDSRYEDEEHSYSPFESESKTNPEFVAAEGDESERYSEDGVSLNDNDYDEGFDWTDVLPDQVINPKPVVSSDVQSLVALKVQTILVQQGLKILMMKMEIQMIYLAYALLMRILALVSKNYIGSN